MTDMDDMIEVTIFDGDGNVVEHSFAKAQTATQEQIDDMVAMIENGTPAWLSARLATQCQ